MPSFPRRFAAAGLVGVAALLALAAHAQQVYRIVGPDGKITFSDRPPPDGKATTAPTVGMGPGTAGSAPLPLELRAVASKYPVTLYSAKECAPCGAGRSFLQSRGIPYSERTVDTPDDVDALTRMTGAARLPLLMIGSQQLRGYSEIEWAQFLDAAGYPRQSALPSSYRNPPAAPLVAAATKSNEPASAPAAPSAGTTPATASPPTAAASAPPPNPSGIRF